MTDVLKTPFSFETEITDDQYMKLGMLMLKWGMIDHVVGNCLRVLKGLPDAEAITKVFKLPAKDRMDKISELLKDVPINAEARMAYDGLRPVWKGLREVRNNVAHATPVVHPDGTISLHLRSKQREFLVEDILQLEDLTNYAAHAVLSFRLALGLKDEPGARHPLPQTPYIPEFLKPHIVN